MIAVGHSLVSVIMAGLALAGPEHGDPTYIRTTSYELAQADQPTERREPHKRTPAIGPGQAPRLLNVPVQSQDGDTIGKVESVCMADMEVMQLIVVTPPDGGLDAKRVALDFADVEVQTRETPIIRIADAGQLQAKPRYRYRDPKHQGAVFNDDPPTGSHGTDRRCPA